MNSPLPDSVVVDTNWIVDICLERSERESEQLLVLAESGGITIHVPSFCLAEAVKVIEAFRQGQRGRSQAMMAEAREAARYNALEVYATALESARAALDEVTDRLQRGVWERLTRVAALDITPFGALHVTLMQMGEILFTLSPGDLAVWASVIELARQSACRDFISADRKAFGEGEVALFLRDLGVRVWPNTTSYLGNLSSRS